MKTLKIILMCCLCSFAVVAQNRYHVNQTKGNDGNDGKSWSNAFATLQRALDDAKADDEIWVAAATYLPTQKSIEEDDDENPASDRYKSFVITNGIKLYGGFPAQADDNTGMNQRDWETHRTILSGDLNHNDGDNFTNMEDNVYRVVILYNTDESTVIDGFTVSGGNYDESWVFIRITLGSGIVGISDASGTSSSPTLKNMIIERNVSRAGGAGFSNKSVTGDACPVISNTIIRHNKSGEYGGGFANEARLKSSPILENVIISGNQAYAGGGMFCMSEGTETSPVLTNVLIHGNKAELNYGGACIYSFTGNIKPVFTNVTITGNKADGLANDIGGTVGGLFCGTETALSTPEIRNTVIAGNKAPRNYEGVDSQNDFVSADNSGFHSNIQFSMIGEPSSILSIGFVRPIDADNAPTTEGDYRPDNGSPLINKGNNTFVTATVDLAGKPRIYDQTVDIGAYEYQQISTVDIQDIIVDNNIWTENGSLFVRTGQPTTVRIFSIDGMLIQQISLGAGTKAISLPQGFYLVSLNNEKATKVYVSK